MFADVERTIDMWRRNGGRKQNPGVAGQLARLSEVDNEELWLSVVFLFNQRNHRE